MSCNFSFNISANATAMVDKARHAITKNGGQFNGDDTQGNFLLSTMAGKIQGNYNVNGNSFSIAITNKPIFLSCGMIEGELKKFLQ